MDPLWASIAEFWWIAPAAAGAGVFTMLGLRHQRAVDARRLEYDAAKLELHDARVHAWSARNSVKLAQAELAHLQAQRAAAHATPDDVAAVRRRLHSAQREAKAAQADVRVRRMRVSAARAGLGSTDPAHRPLARLLAAHDAITARWLEYETDPARLIVFPSMSDGRVPTTAAYLSARAEAQRLRPASAHARITPVEFVAYRRSIDALAQTFDVAEQAAWREARAAGMVPPAPATEPAAWPANAEELIARSAAALARASETAATMAARMGDAARLMRADTTAPPPAAPPAGAAQSPAPPPPSATASPAQRPPTPVWPVPSRSSNHPGP